MEAVLPVRRKNVIRYIYKLNPEWIHENLLVLD